jgi:hypothetical protein
MAEKESCEAELHIGGVRIKGKTGQGNGHAEMDALHNFIAKDPWKQRSIPLSTNFLVNQLSDTNIIKTVSCPSRPCCLKCTEVLRQLRFELASGTEWSNTPMGSTEWGVSRWVQTLFKQLGVNYEQIKNLA